MIFVFFLPQLLLWIVALLCYLYREYGPVTYHRRGGELTTPARTQNLVDNFYGVKVATPMLTPFGTAIPGKCKDINSFSLDMHSPLSVCKEVESKRAKDLCSALEDVFALTTTVHSPSPTACASLSFTSKDDMFLEMSQNRCKMSITLRCLLPLRAMSSTTSLPASPIPLSVSKAFEHQWKSVDKGVFAKFDSIDSLV